MTSSRRPVAAIDIGSNSIKLTVARAGPGGTLDEMHSNAETVRLGAGVEATGRLANDRIDAAMQTLGRFAAEARALGATRLIGVATEATRVASNGPEFLERVRRETGVEVETISGDEEAALTFRGLATMIDTSGGIVVVDIGGGSTEVIVSEDGAVRFARSLRLGSGGLTERLICPDPPRPDEIEACREVAAGFLQLLDLPAGSGTRLILLGGTGEYLARLVPGRAAITAESVGVVLERLTRRPAAAVAAELGIAETRARVLPAGVAIVQAAVDRVQPGGIEVARSGIRAGLLLAAFAEGAKGGNDGRF